MHSKKSIEVSKSDASWYDCKIFRLRLTPGGIKSLERNANKRAPSRAQIFEKSKIKAQNQNCFSKLLKTLRKPLKIAEKHRKTPLLIFELQA